MSALPNGWIQTTLGEVVRLRGEKAIPGTVPHLPFLGLEDVEAHTSRIIKYAQATDVRSAGARFSAGEILYSRLRPYLNKVVTAEVEGLASGEFLVLQPEIDIQSEFIRRRIMAGDFLAFAALLDRGDRPRVNFEQIAEFKILLPPTSEQRRIIAKLEQLLGSVAQARKDFNRIPILISQYKRSILTVAFSGDLTREWRGERGLPDPSVETVEKIISDIRYGTAQKCTPEPHGVAVLRIPNVASGRIDLTDLKYTDLPKKDLERLKIVAGDILIVRSNGSVDLLGRPALVSEREAGLAFAGYLIRIRPNARRVLPEYLSLMLQAPQTRALIERGARSTAGVHNINGAELSALPVLAPTLSEQQEVVDRLNDAFRWLDAVAVEHARAAQLLPKLEQAILAKAFRGELVPQDPYDEPASVLLERIRAKRAAENENPRTRKVRGPNLPRAPEEKAAMTKSRFDPDVKDQPYLAKLIEKEGGKTGVDALFGRADLPVADFFKQLAWEVAVGHVRDTGELLEAA
jgi:type I restriction enzyme, S subunit